MRRKRTIAVLMTAVFGIAVYFVGVLLAGSLSPSKKAETNAREYIPIHDMSPGEYVFSHADGGPYFVEKMGGGQFRVFRLVPQFSDPSVGGSSIRLDSLRWDQKEGCIFFEAARGVCYDYHGKVLRGSHPKALDMKELEWTYVVAGRAIEVLE